MKQGPRVVKPRLGNEGSDRRRGDGVAVEAQMLYGVHVFARAKVILDLAVSRGDEAYPNASEMGDPTLSFSAAGGTAMAHLDLGDVDAAGTWLDRAAAIASANPTPLRARRMETWRGLAAAAAGDADGMRTRLERAAACNRRYSSCPLLRMPRPSSQSANCCRSYGSSLLTRGGGTV